MKIYFIGSIRGGRDDVDLYLKIIEYLKNYGEVLSEHIGDKELAVLGEDELSDEHIYDRDLKLLLSSDACIAEVSTPSLGVGYEISRAEQSKKKILCLYRNQQGKRLSAMIAGNKNLCVKEYISIDDVVRIIDDFFKTIK